MLAAARPVLSSGFRTGRRHGSKAKSPEIEWQEVQRWCEQKRRKCDAPTQTRDAETREERSWREGEEPQAGDRHRTFGGPEKGREGAEQADIAEAILTQGLLTQALITPAFISLEPALFRS